MQLILVSPPDDRPGEPEIVTLMFEAGLQHFHLRKPEFSNEDIEDYLRKIPPHFHHRIILHYQFEIAERFNLKGIHFNSISINHFKDYFNIPGIRSYSIREFEEVFNLRGKIDYVLLSPGFMGILREDSVVLRENLKKLLKKTECPKLVALGGITEQNISELKHLGFWGAAVLSDIWHTTNSSNEMLRKMKQMLSIIQQETDEYPVKNRCH